MAKRGFSVPQTSGVDRVSFDMLPKGANTVYLDNRIYMDDNLHGGPIPFLITDNVIKGPFHLSFMLSVFCAEGQISVTLDGTRYLLEDNSLLVLKPGTMFEATEILSDNCRLAVYALSIEGGHSGMIQIPHKSDLAFVKIVMQAGNVSFMKMNSTFADMFVSMYDFERKVFQNVRPEYLDDALVNFMTTVATIVASLVTDNPRPQDIIFQDRRSEIFQNFLANVHKYAAKERSVSFYAGKAFMSPKYFSAIISENSGHSPSHYIKEYVIIEAKALICSGKYSVQQISSMLNFPNPSFFCKYFKSFAGMSPLEYQKSQLSQQS